MYSKKFILLSLGLCMTLVADQPEITVQPAVAAHKPVHAPHLETGIYRHYKGDYYLVMGVSLHTETEEWLVIYRGLHGEFALFARPYAMFMEDVEYQGKVQKRFAYIRPA